MPSFFRASTKLIINVVVSALMNASWNFEQLLEIRLGNVEKDLCNGLVLFKSAGLIQNIQWSPYTDASS